MPLANRLQKQVSDIWDIQTSSERDLFIASKLYKGDGSFYSRVIQYLIDNGYKFVDEGGIWHAVR